MLSESGYSGYLGIQLKLCPQPVAYRGGGGRSQLLRAPLKGGRQNYTSEIKLTGFLRKLRTNVKR